MSYLKEYSQRNRNSPYVKVKYERSVREIYARRSKYLKGCVLILCGSTIEYI